MLISGLIPRNFAEIAEAVPIGRTGAYSILSVMSPYWVSISGDRSFTVFARSSLCLCLFDIPDYHPGLDGFDLLVQPYQLDCV